MYSVIKKDILKEIDWQNELREEWRSVKYNSSVDILKHISTYM